MNKEDEKLIAEYMCWQEDELLVGYCIAPDRTAHFNLNDAGLCVKEMDKRDDWYHFVTYVNANNTERRTWTQFFAWLYDADNFFESMAKWLEEENK